MAEGFTSVLQQICCGAAGAGCLAWGSPWLPPTDIPEAPHCQHQDPCTQYNYNWKVMYFSLVNNILEMWKRECCAKCYYKLMLSALLLEANAFCCLAIPCQTGLLPQSSVFLVNYLVAGLIQVLFLQYF